MCVVWAESVPKWCVRDVCHGTMVLQHTAVGDRCRRDGV
jgi:hypothetical protein